MIINTYYQLIFSLHLCNSIFEDDDIILCVTDHSKNIQNVVNEISKENIFEEVIYLKTKNIDFDTRKYNRIKDTFSIALERQSRYDILLDSIKCHKIDEILFYNTGYLLIDAILSYFSKSSMDISLSMFEEGILSYKYDFDFFKSRKIINKIRKINNMIFYKFIGIRRLILSLPGFFNKFLNFS